MRVSAVGNGTMTSSVIWSLKSDGRNVVTGVQRWRIVPRKQSRHRPKPNDLCVHRPNSIRPTVLLLAAKSKPRISSRPNNSTSSFYNIQTRRLSEHAGMSGMPGE